MRVYFITGNEHKLEEASEAVRDLGVELVRGPEGLRKEEVQSDSIEEVSLSAARALLPRLSEPFVVEDDGLFMDAYRGFPGPYTAYAYRTIGLAGVIALARAANNFSASFRSAVALQLGGRIYLFTAAVRGSIAEAPRGSRGFGFDPIFIPEGQSRTFAEMTVQEKSGISHRAKAFRRMAMFLRSASATG